MSIISEVTDKTYFDILVMYIVTLIIDSQRIMSIHIKYFFGLDVSKNFKGDWISSLT
jgi:hypothetical protein